jgi:methyl-accepting chemotaxis protein
LLGHALRPLQPAHNQVQGMDFQIDTSYLLNTKGERIGHVEAVQEISALVRVGEYQESEAQSLAATLASLADGNLSVSATVADGDEHTAAARRSFLTIADHLAAKAALGTACVMPVGEVGAQAAPPLQTVWP